MTDTTPLTEATRFTPGPWRIEREPYIHVRSDAGCVMAADYTTDENARLIAAAPDLFEALSDAVNGLGSQPGYLSERALVKARAALAKALWHTGDDPT